MSRLIDADAVIEKCSFYKGWSEKADYEIQLVKDILNETPTVDVEPVVRCEDCKYFMDGNGCHLLGVDYTWEEQMGADDFCSLCEKR